MTTNKYQLWLETNGGRTKLQLPVNPEKITIKDTAQTNSFFVGGLGEVVVSSGMKAVQISFSSIFPKEYFPGCEVKKPLSPRVYKVFLEALVRYGTVFKFRITGIGITWNVIADSFTYSESGGDVGTYEYSVVFKEFISVKPKQININKINGKISENKSPARVNTTQKPETYTTQQGDCLYNIARQIYGDGSQYMKIYNANKNLIGSNPNLIGVGVTLTIP